MADPKRKIEAQLGAPPPLRPLPDKPPPNTVPDAAQRRAEETRKTVEQIIAQEDLARRMDIRNLPAEVAEMVDPHGAFTHMLPREASRIVNVAAGRHSDADLLSDESIRTIAENKYLEGKKGRMDRVNVEIIEIIEQGAAEQRAARKAEQIRALRPASPRVEAAKRRYR